MGLAGLRDTPGDKSGHWGVSRTGVGVGSACGVMRGDRRWNPENTCSHAHFPESFSGIGHTLDMQRLGWDATAGWIRSHDGAVAKYLYDYLASDTQTYLGRYFEPLTRQAASDRFDAYDLAALWSLSVTIKPKGRHQLLHTRATDLSDLLKDCRSVIKKDRRQGSLMTCDIDQLTAESSPFIKLWDLLMEVSDVGQTKTSKLMAAKFPELIPVWDSQVSGLLNEPITAKHWRPMQQLLTANESAIADMLIKPPTRGLNAQQRSALVEALKGVTVARRLDVVLWMMAQQPTTSTEEGSE